MAKKKVTYDLFARITVDENVDPDKIVRVLHNACIGQAWGFSANIQEEMEDEQLTVEDLIGEDDY